MGGKVPNLCKKSKAEASRDGTMRGAHHIYYIHFGQYTHPMGSGRPPWAAGESYISYSPFREENLRIYNLQMFGHEKVTFILVES